MGIGKSGRIARLGSMLWASALLAGCSLLFPEPRPVAGPAADPVAGPAVAVRRAEVATRLGRMPVEVAGAAGGTIVLLPDACGPGGARGAGKLDAYRRFLVARGWRVVVPEWARTQGCAHAKKGHARDLKRTVALVDGLGKGKDGKPTRLVVMGWAYGGAVAVEALAQRPKAVERAVAIAPDCRRMARRVRVKSPALSMSGDADDGLGSCIQRMVGGGLELAVYPERPRDFDEPGADGSVSEAYLDAVETLKEFLGRPGS